MAAGSFALIAEATVYYVACGLALSSLKATAGCPATASLAGAKTQLLAPVWRRLPQPMEPSQRLACVENIFWPGVCKYSAHLLVFYVYQRREGNLKADTNVKIFVKAGCGCQINNGVL
jgi:hypothetical protein